MELESSKSAKACFILRKAYWVRGRAMFCVSCAWVARGRGTLLGAGLGASSSTTRIKVAGAPPTRGSNTPPDRIPHLSSRYTSSRAFKPLYSRNLTLLLLFNKICEIFNCSAYLWIYKIPYSTRLESISRDFSRYRSVIQIYLAL